MNLNINHLNFKGRLIISDKDKQSSKKAFEKVGVDSNIINNIPVNTIKGDIYANVNYSQILHKVKTIRVNYSEIPVEVNSPSDFFIYSIECDPKTMGSQLPRLMKSVGKYSDNSKKIDDAMKNSDNKLQIINDPIIRGCQYSQEYDDGDGAKMYFNSLAGIANVAKNTKGVTKMHYDNKTNMVQYTYLEDDNILRCGNIIPNKNFQKNIENWLTEMPQFMAERKKVTDITKEMSESQNNHIEIDDRGLNGILSTLPVSSVSALASSLENINQSSKKSSGVVNVNVGDVHKNKTLKLDFYKTDNGEKEQIKSDTFKIDDKLGENVDGLIKDMPKFVDQWDKFDETMKTLGQDNDKILIDSKSAKAFAWKQDSKSLKQMTDKLVEVNKKAQDSPGHMNIKFDDKNHIVVTHNKNLSASEMKSTLEDETLSYPMSPLDYTGDDSDIYTIARGALLGMIP